MDLSTFLVVCFVVSFLYLGKIALERKKEKDDRKRKSDSHNRKLEVWNSYLKYLESEYEETQSDGHP